MTRTVAAVAAIYETITGYDREDEMSVDRPVKSWLVAAARGLGGLRIGIARAGQFRSVDPEIETAVHQAAMVFADLGATMHDIDLGDPDSPHTLLKLPVPTNIAARNRERPRQNPETFGPDVRERVSLSRSPAVADYADWLRLIERRRMQMRRLFESVDIIAVSTVPSPAPLATESADMIDQRGATWLTFIWSYLQLPGLSAPCSFIASNLPIGMQLIGPQWSGARLLADVALYQNVTGFHRGRPPPYV